MAIKYLIIILLLTIFAFNLPAQGHYDLNYIENLALRNIGIIAFTIGMTANITGLAVAIPNSFGRDPVAVTAGVLMIFLGGEHGLVELYYGEKAMPIWLILILYLIIRKKDGH